MEFRPLSNSDNYILLQRNVYIMYFSPILIFWHSNWNWFSDCLPMTQIINFHFNYFIIIFNYWIFLQGLQLSHTVSSFHPLPSKGTDRLYTHFTNISPTFHQDSHSTYFLRQTDWEETDWDVIFQTFKQSEVTSRSHLAMSSKHEKHTALLSSFWVSEGLNLESMSRPLIRSLNRRNEINKTKLF